MVQDCQGPGEFWDNNAGLCCPLQEEHERLLQAAVEQAEGLEHNLRSAEAVLAERAAQLKDAQVSARGVSAVCPCLAGTPAWEC